MAKVTSKLQVTVPKALADRYGIAPGDEIEWEPAGDVIRVIPGARRTTDPASRLRVFEQATLRHAARRGRRRGQEPTERGWSREDLYVRDRAR